MTSLIDLTTPFGIRAAQRLEEEWVIWLTSVSLEGMPQPRPVWFLWENNSFVILSTPTARKLKHILRNPKVALHFDGGKEGEDIAVFLGQASIETSPLSQNIIDRYITKYADEIIRIGLTNETFLKDYSVVMRVIPTRLRGIY